MPQLRGSGTNSTGVEISDAHVRFLRTHLETMTAEATKFYVDAVTIELLAEDQAPSLLVNRLREVLAGRDCADLELVGAAPPAEDEVPVVIDRRAAPRVTEDGVAESEEADDPDAVVIAGRKLRCVVCRAQGFRHRRAQLHSKAASFMNVEWLGPTADCYVCNGCGYVHWFMT